MDYSSSLEEQSPTNYSPIPSLAQISWSGKMQRCANTDAGHNMLHTWLLDGAIVLGNYLLPFQAYFVNKKQKVTGKDVR